VEIRVEVTGVEEVLRRLDGLVSEAALRRGLAGAAHLVEGVAKVKAPVDTGFFAQFDWGALCEQP
jgi:hypothetical protein